MTEAAEYSVNTPADTAAVFTTQAWEYYKTVTVYKQNGRIGNANHRVEYDSDSGRFRIQYGGEWYPVYNAPRGCGYTHTFSTGNSTWYFNL